MAVVAISAFNAVKSSYQLLVTTPQEKKEAAENLILAIIRIASAMLAYAVLYVADQHLQGIQMKVLVTIGAFCLHPTATLDYQFFRGVQIFREGAPYRAVFRDLESRLRNQAFGQAEAEGYYTIREK